MACAQGSVLVLIFVQFQYSSKENENVENTVNNYTFFDSIMSTTSIYINNHKVELADNVKYLGVFIDSHLN